MQLHDCGSWRLGDFWFWIENQHISKQRYIRLCTKHSDCNALSGASSKTGSFHLTLPLPCLQKWLNGPPLVQSPPRVESFKLKHSHYLNFTLCYKFGSKNSVNCFWFSFVNISVRGPWTRLIWLPTILHQITTYEPYRVESALTQITYYFTHTT